MPVFVVTCSIQKESNTYVSVEKKSGIRIESKHSSAQKLLAFLYEDYSPSRTSLKMNLKYH